MSEAVRFVHSLALRFSVKLLVENSVFATDGVGNVIEVRLGPGADLVDIEFRNSSCTSASSIAHVSGSSYKQPSLSTIHFTASDSYFKAPSFVFDVAPCDAVTSHVTLDIHNNTFYLGAITVQTSYVDGLVSSNFFHGNSRALCITFCNSTSSHVSKGHVSQLLIENNHFADSTSDDAVSFVSKHTNISCHRIDISGNIFLHDSNQDRGGILISSGADDTNVYTMTSNNFTNSGGSAILAQGGFGGLNVTNNRFEASLCAYGCINIIGKNNEGFVNIHGNIFHDNYPEISVINLRQARGGNVTYSVSRNFFENNTGVLLTTNMSFVTIHENFFEHAEAQYTLQVTTPDDTYVDDVINASHNYWGTADVNVLARSIYGKAYVENLSRINFRPYLGSKNYSDVQNEDRSLESPSRKLGGAVNGNVTLTAEGGPYLVSANIEVQHGGVLTLTEGIVLKFKEHIGMIVNG